MDLTPTSVEIEERDAMLAGLLEAISENRRILLGPQGQPPFSGTVASYRYWFEGEDDLLHLTVTSAEGAELAVEEAQGVVAFVLPHVRPGLIWLRPGTLSHHFYVGHDELLTQD